MKNPPWAAVVKGPVWTFPILVPIGFFLLSFYIKPAVNHDSAFGFAVLRSMLDGAPFNHLVQPDPLNIANDLVKFLTWWSPGQYLVPGIFIWFGADLDLAISLTVLFSSITGVIGWARVAQSFQVSRFASLAFLWGLVTFRYATQSSEIYLGGEILLFAAAPWCLCWLRLAIGQPPTICFVIVVMSAIVLFIAKLSGLVVFATIVGAIGILELVQKRRVTYSLLALGAGSVVSAVLFEFLWHRHGGVPASTSGFGITWPAVWFPVAASIFSGFSAIDFLSWLLHYRPKSFFSGPGIYVMGLLGGVGVALIFWHLYQSTLFLQRKILLVLLTIAGVVIFVIAGIFFLRIRISFNQHQVRDAGLAIVALAGLSLVYWVWRQLKDTQYRLMADFTIVSMVLYSAALTVMYASGSQISFEERHFRYVGILFFLLCLVALEQLNWLHIRSLTIGVISTFSVYGMAAYAVNARELLRGSYYEQLSFTLQQPISPNALQYLRSQMKINNWRRAVVAIPAEAAMSLPGYRIIPADMNYTPNEHIPAYRRAGRVEKLFVVMPEYMIGNGKADLFLKCFVDYEPSAWSEKKIDGTVIYSQ